MLECGEGHQSAVDVGRRRYSYFVSVWSCFCMGLVWTYISVVDDDERVGGVSGGYESNAHCCLFSVVSLSLSLSLFSLSVCLSVSPLSDCVFSSCCLSLSLPAVTVTDSLSLLPYTGL